MAEKPKLDLSIVGRTGLPVWHGRVYDEYLTVLQGESGRRVLREMSEQDPIVGGILFGIEMLARQVPWTVRPADKTAESRKVADFVETCLTDMSPTWEDTLSEIFSMLVYGWSWLEILYKRRQGLNPGNPTKNSKFDDGKIGWRGWSIRSQESLFMWEYDKDKNSPTYNEITGMTQQAPPDYETLTIPRSKSLHFMTRSRRQNPEGISILRNAYRAWYMKKNIEQIEGIGIERDLAGLPVLWAPANLFSTDSTDEEKAMLEMLKKLVTSIRRDEQEGVLMPLAYDEDKNEEYKLELLSTGGDRQFDTNAIVGRYNEGIAMSMLADFILMGHQAVGSYALSDNKTALFATALGASLDSIVAEINKEAITRLVLLNGWPLKRVPQLEHGDIESADLAKLGDFLKKLGDAGMPLFPNAPLEKYLLKQAGLPSDPAAEDARAKLAEVAALVPGADGTMVPPDDPKALNPTNPAILPQPAPATPALAPGAKPGPSGRPTSSKSPAPGPTRPRTAGESKHFVPLATRVSRVAERLEDSMEPDQYRELLAEVMTAGKFSALAAESQALLLAAESAE